MEDCKMKKALLIIALLFTSAHIHASHAGSELNIRIMDNSWFTVLMDGQSFNEPVTRFHLDNIMPGRHHLTITKVGSRSHHGMGAIRHHVVFSGFVDIPASSRLKAVVDRANRFRINRIEPLIVHHVPIVTSPSCHAPIPAACAPAAQYHMDDYAFDGLMGTLRGMHFESSRMSVVRNAVYSNHFSARQVAELMSAMTFDSSRLEVAKLAYGKTVDKENYWLVYDLFTFESSIVELNQYINRA
ncbi:MAG: DUF4476 domain-containing protein [Bacteroidota bacterium]|jgi:hypothetical protein